MEDERSVPEHRKYEFKAFLRLLSSPRLAADLGLDAHVGVQPRVCRCFFREPVSRRNTS